MKTIFHTNIDGLKQEFNFVWLDGTVPPVGSLIQSPIKHNEYNVELEVVKLRFELVRSTWICKVELHLPQHRWVDLRSFYDWYERISGKI